MLPERLNAVLAVLYLVFNEGYSATSGQSLIRVPLSSEAIRLGRVLCELMPDEPEAIGLLALMLLQDSRREARVSSTGDLVVLEEQDRTLWNREQINEGTRLVEHALRLRRPGPYQIQAAIAALHGAARSPEDTDWTQIAWLYKALVRITGSPIVELNYAAAVAMAESPDRGLDLMDPAGRFGRFGSIPSVPCGSRRPSAETGSSRRGGRGVPVRAGPDE